MTWKIVLLLLKRRAVCESKCDGLHLFDFSPLCVCVEECGNSARNHLEKENSAALTRVTDWVGQGVTGS